MLDNEMRRQYEERTVPLSEKISAARDAQFAVNAFAQVAHLKEAHNNPDINLPPYENIDFVPLEVMSEILGVEKQDGQA